MRRLFFSLIAAACTDPVAPSPSAVPIADPPPTQPAAPPCVGPIVDGPSRSFTIGARTWTLAGSTLVLREPLEEIRLGVLSDIKDAAEENQANLKALAVWFGENQIDAVVVAGDTGVTQQDIENNLHMLLGLNVPVLAIIGNREPRDAYRAALDRLHQSTNRVFDLSRVRRVDTSVADIVSLPGYYSTEFTHEAGCVYRPEDVAEVGKLVTASDSPVVLVSHGPPLQAGSAALDWTSQEANVGDPLLAELLKRHDIPFGIFGNIHEAGGGATDLLGATRLSENSPHARVYLNPGPADSVRWRMNHGPESRGMGAVFRILKDKTALFATKRL
jgi:Icc-related predicted phosphoesterase